MFFTAPVDHTFNLVGIVRNHLYTNLFNFTLGIGDNVDHAHEGAVSQTDNLTRHHTEEAFFGVLRKVFFLDVDVFCDGVLLCALGWVSREERSFNNFIFYCIEVDQFEKNRVSHTESASSRGVEFLSSIKFKFLVGSDVLISSAGHSNSFTEGVNHGRSVTSALKALNCVETRVVPARD